MLSDHDRRTLRELERRLAIDDDAYVRRFDVTAPPRQVPQHGSAPHGSTPHGSTPHGSTPHGSGVAQIAGSLVLGLLMLLAGSIAGAAAFLGAAAAVGLAWWYVQDPRPERGDPGNGTQA